MNSRQRRVARRKHGQEVIEILDSMRKHVMDNENVDGKLEGRLHGAIRRFNELKPTAEETW
jgi:hypothetical protein